MTASFAAAIEPQCGCTHDRHLIDHGIDCGGPRREIDGIVYCLSCWAATFQPHLAIANDRRGVVRVLNFGMLDTLFRLGQISGQQAWEACRLPGPEWRAYAALREKQAEPPPAVGVQWGQYDPAGLRLGWVTLETGIHVQWEGDEHGWHAPTGKTIDPIDPYRQAST